MSTYSYEPSRPASARSPVVSRVVTRNVTRGFWALMKNVPQSWASCTVRFGYTCRSRARLRDSRARTSGAVAASIATRGSTTDEEGSGCRVVLARAAGAPGCESGAGRANLLPVGRGGFAAARGVGVAWAVVVSAAGAAAIGGVTSPPSRAERVTTHQPAAAASATTGRAHATTGTRRGAAGAALVVLGFGLRVAGRGLTGAASRRTSASALARPRATSWPRIGSSRVSG